ncbi:hypothetical protein ACOSP7_010456 [Xanthoceras sorbifolium]
MTINENNILSTALQKQSTWIPKVVFLHLDCGEWGHNDQFWDMTHEIGLTLSLAGLTCIHAVDGCASPTSSNSIPLKLHIRRQVRQSWAVPSLKFLLNTSNFYVYLVLDVRKQHVILYYKFVKN